MEWLQAISQSPVAQALISSPTLYLLVKDKEGRWVFPQDRLADENLHGVCISHLSP